MATQAEKYYLGWMYANGKGVGKDEIEAVKWVRKAAEQGNEKAKQFLDLLRKSEQ